MPPTIGNGEFFGPHYNFCTHSYTQYTIITFPFIMSRKNITASLVGTSVIYAKYCIFTVVKTLFVFMVYRCTKVIIIIIITIK